MLNKILVIILLIISFNAISQTPSEITYIYNARQKTYDAVWKRQSIVDLSSSGVSGATSYLESVKSITTEALAVAADSNRYIASANGATWIKDRIYQYNGATWTETTPTSGQATLVVDSVKWFVYTTVWTGQSTPSSWATSGTNIFNTNTGNVGIGTVNPIYKLEVDGDFSCKNTLYVDGVSITRYYGLFDNNQWGIGNGYALWRVNPTRSHITFSNYTTNSYSLDLHSGSTLGGRIRLFTKNTERLGIDSTGLITISNKTVGTSDSILVRESNAIKYRTDILDKGDTTSLVATQYDISTKADKSTTLTINGIGYDLSTNRSWTISAASPQVNQILVKRLAKADTVITNIDLIANNTLFPDADSVQFYLYGNFTATVNLFNNYTKVYAGDAIITRTSANAGRLIDRNNTANGYMWWDGGSITSYAECYRTVANCKDKFQPKYAVTTNADAVVLGGCVGGVTAINVIIGKQGGTIKSTGGNGVLTCKVDNSYFYGSFISTNTYAFQFQNTDASTGNWFDVDTINNATVNQVAFYCNEANGIKYFKAKSVVAKVGYTALQLSSNATKGVYIDYVSGIINNGGQTQINSNFNIGKWDNAGGVSRYGFIINGGIINIDNSNVFTWDGNLIPIYVFNSNIINVTRTTANYDIGDTWHSSFEFNCKKLNIIANGFWIYSPSVVYNNCEINHNGSPTSFSRGLVYSTGTVKFNNCTFNQNQTTGSNWFGIYGIASAGGTIISKNSTYRNLYNNSGAYFFRSANTSDNLIINNCSFFQTNVSAAVHDGVGTAVNLWLYNNSYTNSSTPFVTTPTMKTTLNSGNMSNEATNVY